MALQNYFTNYTPDQGGHVKEQWAVRGPFGVPDQHAQITIPIGAADNLGSTYCIIKNAPADGILASMLGEVSAMSGATSVSVGLYDSDTGAPIAPNCYLNAANLSAGSTKLAPFDLAAALTHDATMQQLYLLAGHTLQTKKGSYDVVLTLNTAPVQAGNFTVRTKAIPSG